MAFNSTLPAHRTRIVSAELRENFTALKALIDAQAAQIAALTAGVITGQVPIGAVLPWFKDTPGVPSLPAHFVECNGQVLSDPESPLDGQLMPDINTGAQRFVRGGMNSGGIGGIDYFATAQADFAGVDEPPEFRDD